MRALIQRVTSASVIIENDEKRSIDNGIVILLGVSTEDTPDLCEKLALKCATLRIFNDEDGKMNKSAVDLGYSALVVSNFTLYGDTKKGRRPSYTNAAKEPLSVDCYEIFLSEMQKHGLNAVESGEFGASMQIELVNDGPVTLMLDTDEWA